MDEMEFVKHCIRLNMELANKHMTMQEFRLAMHRVQDARQALEYFEKLLTKPPDTQANPYIDS